ncbi:MAG: mechanosensitive ion channel [Gammaproteobacteria bacterium]|uniref:Mechanosensitive ion channel n=1 Tax=Candidatus Thiopontia autotrophica TaxID=2841688 RepID=A0A8J6PA59_9GAMM|nr:mechanosensitive ion channel [Candidatus Thiopontia autotrophica]MBL6968937.1 mechanosensitive ion channel [Gammaproteobacteria bacterium]
MLAVATAFWTQKNITNYLQLVADGNYQSLRRFTRHSLKRIIFPLSMMFVVLVGRVIVERIFTSAILLNVAVPLLFSLALIRLMVYLLRRAFKPGPLVKAWEHLISTSIWIIVALHLLGWLPEVVRAMDVVGVSVGDVRISLRTVVKLFVVVGALLALAAWISRMIENTLRHSRHLTAAAKVGIGKSSKFALYILAVLIALNSVGIDLTALAVFGGALGVGLGFGLQRIASNFISGFILIFDRSIRPGDVISINDKFGWVQELRARYVVVRDRDGVETLVPNENLITTEVINWSYSDHQVRLKLPVQISYKDDPEQAMKILVNAAKACKRALDDPAPVARLMEFGDNGIELELRVWIMDPNNGVGSVRSDINLVIWREFKKAGITIPYPQRDIRLVDGASLEAVDG